MSSDPPTSHQPNMPAWASWKFWAQRKYKHNKLHATDYIYLQWHFLTSQHETAEETYRTYDVVDNIERSGQGSDSQAIYCDVKTWLDSQPQPSDLNKEIYCDCCQTSSSPSSSNSYSSSSLYSSSSSSSLPKMYRRHDSVSSVTTDICDCSYCVGYLDISDDESLYSSQLRRKSRDIFLAV